MKSEILHNVDVRNDGSAATGERVPVNNTSIVYFSRKATTETDGGNRKSQLIAGANVSVEKVE